MYKFSHGVYHNSPACLTYVCEGVGKQDTPEPAHDWQQLVELALDRGLKTLWILPSAGEFRPMENHEEWSFTPTIRHKRIATVSVWKRGVGKNVNLIFLGNTGWSEAWPGIEAKDLLLTIRYIETRLGIRVTGSPGATGWNYLKKIHPEWVEDIPGVNLKECHFDARSGRDIIWQRSIQNDELQRKYLVKFDGNSEYPYALTQTDVGVGTPRYVNHGRDMDDFQTSKGTTRQSQAVGVWNCLIFGMEVSPPVLPTPWAHGSMLGRRWLSGPMIRLFRAIGYTVEPIEGWVFPEQHQVFAKWSKDLGQARKEFKDINKKAATLAASGVKRIANSTVGFTAFKGFTDQDTEEEKRRPDIRLQAVTKSAEIIWHNIRKIYELTGLLPVMVYMDALYYLVDDTQGQPVRAHFAKRETELGGFKFVGRIEVTPLVVECLTVKSSVANKLEYLNKIGWVK